MSVQTSQDYAPADIWQDDQTDLRKYIDIFIKRWREIAVITIAVVIVTAATLLILHSTRTPMYEASASAALVRMQVRINLDDRLTSQSSGTDVNSRRNALLGLALNGAIAERVAAELGDQLDAREQKPTTLLRRITAKLSSSNGRSAQSPESDLIVITARADSPEKAAAIANAWTRHYVQEANRVFGQVPDEMMASVQAELDQAKTNYEDAQRNLEQFLATSPVNTLRRQVQETQDTLAALQSADAGALSAYMEGILASYKRITSIYLAAQADSQILGFQSEHETQRQLLNAYFNAYRDAVVTTLDVQRERDTRLIRMYHDQWLRVTAALSAARTLQAGLAQGGEGAVTSTATALQLLKLQLVSAMTGDLPSLQDTTATQKAGDTSSMSTSLMDGANKGAGASVNAPPNMKGTSAAPGAGELPSQLVQIAPAIELGVVSSTTQPPVFQVNLTPDPDATLAGLTADLDGIIQGLETRLQALEQDIAGLNAELLSGERYQGLGAKIPDESALVDAIREGYPDLFAPGVLSSIAEDAAQGSALAGNGQAQAAELLKLAGIETLLLSGQPEAPMADSIARLDERLKTFQSQLEEQEAMGRQVTQRRDLAWEAFTALSNKQAELTLERASANSELRLGAAAIPPDAPSQQVGLMSNVLLAGAIGLLFAVLLAFLLEYLGKPPLFTHAPAKG